MKITITRANNGWILEEEKSYEYDESTYTAQEVFEDPDASSEEYGEALSLASLLHSAFLWNFQSKHTPGLVLDVMEESKERDGQLAEAEEDPVLDFRDFFPVMGDKGS